MGARTSILFTDNWVDVGVRSFSSALFQGYRCLRQQGLRLMRLVRLDSMLKGFKHVPGRLWMDSLTTISVFCKDLTTLAKEIILVSQ